MNPLQHKRSPAASAERRTAASSDSPGSKVVMTLWLNADGHFEVDTDSIPGADLAVDVITDGVREVASSLARRVNELDDAGQLRTMAKSRSPVADTLGNFTEVVVGSAADASVSASELKKRLQVTSDTVDVVFQGDSRELDSLIDNLTPVSLPSPEDDEAAARRAEARGRLRLEALYRKLIRESFTVKDLTAFRLSRQRLQQLRKEDRLFAVEVPNQKGLLHPRWQFDETNRPRPELPDLIAAARDGGLDAIGFHQLMLNPEATDEGALVDLLDRGRVEDVIEILRAGGG